MKSVISRPVSYLWSNGSRMARKALERGWLKAAKLESRVISVGNLQAGGSGKTPLVAQIAREAAARGKSVCILSRGYGGYWEKAGGVLKPGRAAADARICGDEPALLHELAPEAYLGVGADRVRQYQEVCKELGERPDLVILDDGFQHWKIKKDLEIVALTSLGPSKTPHRDDSEALRFADLVVWTKGSSRPDAQGRPFVKVTFRLKREKEHSSPLWLVTGVANGAEVRASCDRAGYSVKKHSEFSDHARYDAKKVRTLMSDAAKMGCQVAVTGKDWVKWRGLGIDRGKVLVLEPEVEFEEGRDLWNRTLWDE